MFLRCEFTFWTRKEIYSLATQSFDLAYRSGSEPFRAARADFLNPSPIDTIPGRLAFTQHGIPGSYMARGGGIAWHHDISPTLRALDPELPLVAPTANANAHTKAVKRTVETLIKRFKLKDLEAVASRRMREDANQLVLDAALASYVFSAHPALTSFPLPTPSDPLELPDVSRLQLEPSQPSTSMSKEPPKPDPPPHVQFAHLRPRAKRKLKNPRSRPKKKKNAPPEEEPKVELPLGVRLLLNDWTLGADVDKYVWKDPYGDDPNDEEWEEDAPPVRELPMPKRVAEPSRPPVILTASTLKREGSVPVQSTRRNFGFGFESSQQSQSQDLGPSTQVLPGPFGARPAATGKKPAKKRMGGF